MNLILVGPKACGKSTVGRIAARSLGAPFRDSDEVLEDVHRERTGERKTFREIFRERGEECFRDLEREALERCLRDGDGDRVVALGGGTPVRLAGDASLEGSGFIVYLDLPEEILWERMSRQGLPVYLDPADPRADFRRGLEERGSVYERIADVRVDADRSPEAIAAEVVARFKARPEKAPGGRPVRPGEPAGGEV